MSRLRDLQGAEGPTRPTGNGSITRRKNRMFHSAIYQRERELFWPDERSGQQTLRNEIWSFVRMFESSSHTLGSREFAVNRFNDDSAEKDGSAERKTEKAILG